MSAAFDTLAATLRWIGGGSLATLAVVLALAFQL